MFSSVRLKGGSQDATDAQAAHNSIKRIMQCGLIKTSSSANVFSDCSYISTTRQLQDVSESSTSNLQFPEDISKSIEDLQYLSPHLDYGILAASAAFLAGYVGRTVEERIHCTICLDSLLTMSSGNPLLALIHLQDKGALKYPTRRFTLLINKLINLILWMVEHLPVDCSPSEILTSILLDPLASSYFCLQEAS